MHYFVDQLKPTSPIFIGGPTAAGKSEIALALAEKIGGEIISVDSMQVYRGLDIGTAKPSPPERNRVPHHLIDICDLRETFDAAQFVDRARTAVADIHARHRTPVFCGGTGLYFKAFLEGLGAAPATRAPLRAELEATPLENLLAELQTVDPATYETIDKRNPRRVVRAIEVIRLTGQPFSAQRAVWAAPASRSPAPNFFVLYRPTRDSHIRINQRVDKMFARGLLAETEQLLQDGLAHNKTAMQAIGYRQVAEHLRGERNLSETVELVKIRTRQFAKRQLTWFRRHAHAHWIELLDRETAEETAVRILAIAKT
jgi:tRNA dimethylallyltransferase